MTAPSDIAGRLKVTGRELGFNVVRIAPAVQPPGYHPLLEWMKAGYDADMQWISRRSDAYAHPNGVMPGTRSVIVVAMNYHNQSPPEGRPRIARYAWGTEDYHSLMRRRLKRLAGALHESLPDEKTRVVVDTAPLLERDFARLAGIGWFGKNTMLISRDIGSWFFLGALLTTAELPNDEPFQQEFCGTCTACLEACPTDAFPEPYVLDSNRCISYLTIERRDKSVTEELRSRMGDWIFGCDVCQEVCPWNRFAPDESPEEFHLRSELRDVELVDLLEMDQSEFAHQFANTPLERTGRNVIVRNAAIVAGNSGSRDLLKVLRNLLSDDSALVRDSADWAIKQIERESVSD